MAHVEKQETPRDSSSAAFWAALIFIGFILATINFIDVMSASHDDHHQDNGIEAHH